MRVFTPPPIGKKNHLSNQLVWGFTLLEILISAAILILVIAGIFMVLNISDMSWQTDMGLVELQQEARRAMDGMVREIRQSKAEDITISADGLRVDFKIPTDITTDPITYSSTISYYLSNERVIREHPAGTEKVLANDINSLSFSPIPFSGNILGIQLNAKKTLRQRELWFPPQGEGIEKFLLEQVRLRN